QAEADRRVGYAAANAAAMHDAALADEQFVQGVAPLATTAAAATDAAFAAYANGQTQRLNAYFADKASSNKLLDVEYATLAKAYWKDLAAVEMLYQLDLVNEQSDAEKDK